MKLPANNTSHARNSNYAPARITSTPATFRKDSMGDGEKFHRISNVGVAVTPETMKMPGIDILRAIMNGTLPQAGISKSLNFWIAEVDEGRVVFAGEPGEESINPMGGAHIRWIEIGDGRRFHVQAGDISRVHVEKQTHFALSAIDFDATLARFRRDGIAFTDMAGTPGAINTRPDGMRAIFLRDPNGYWFEINDFGHAD